MSWARSAAPQRSAPSFMTLEAQKESFDRQLKNLYKMDKQWQEILEKEKIEKASLEDIPVKEDAEAAAETEVVVKQEPLVEVLKTVDSAETKTTEYPEETFTEQLY